MPEVAGSWPEEGSEYLPGAPMEPVQQSYHQQAQYQQAYPQQPYGEAPQYPQQQQQQQQYGAAQASAYAPTQQQAVFVPEEHSSVPSEFDHLFRDSVPQDRRSISRQAVIGAAPPAAGFAQAPQPGPQQQAPTAMFTPDQAQAQAGYPQQAPYGGEGYQPLPARPERSRTPLVIGGVVVVVAAVGLYLGLSGGSGKPSGHPSANGAPTISAAPKQTAQQQADALYQLVSAAKALRSDINGGYSALLNCDIPTAQTEIGRAVSGRKAALATLDSMETGKIDGGTELVGDLKTAWTYSFTSDNDYAKAADDFAHGATCSKAAVMADSNIAAAGKGSSNSSRAKATAASAWNRIMAKYNEPQISSSQF